MTKYGPWDGCGWYRYSTPPSHPPIPLPRVHPLPGPGMLPALHGWYGGVNMVVGLILVAQLTLGAHFSGFWTITEVHNLLYVGIINNHKYIPGND